MNIGIIGATGFTGIELVKILYKHPDFKISILTSESNQGKYLSDLYPFFKGIVNHRLVGNDFDMVKRNCDAVFLCLPHAEAQDAAAFFYNSGKIVIDLSADFRFSNNILYEKTYNVKHKYPELLKESVYGLSEIFKSEIKKTRLIANPGCYSTSVILPLYPLIKRELIYFDEMIIADAKSGVSGAGKKPTDKNLFCEVDEDFKPYSIFSHRHNPEINFILSELTDTNIEVLFTPHLLPISRGIETTMYTISDKPLEELINCVTEFYKNCPFVRIYTQPVPSVKNVAYTNFIDIGIYKQNDKVVIVSCIDNLLKGASGQAVQNLNIIAAIDETRGLL